MTQGHDLLLMLTLEDFDRECDDIFDCIPALIQQVVQVCPALIGVCPTLVKLNRHTLTSVGHTWVSFEHTRVSVGHTWVSAGHAGGLRSRVG